MLVELACGAALAAGYSDSLQQLIDSGELSLHNGNVVLVVCGGSLHLSLKCCTENLHW